MLNEGESMDARRSRRSVMGSRSVSVVFMKTPSSTVVPGLYLLLRSSLILVHHHRNPSVTLKSGILVSAAIDDW